MAKIFLDTNFFIDLVERKPSVKVEKFRRHFLHLSPLSIHILIYVYRYKIPNPHLGKLLEYFSLVPLDSGLVENSLAGPTNDFEDNIQLHSASFSDCAFFLTTDRKLLNLRFFGRTRIQENFPV